ncbi:hypothetical protein Ancab_037023 [Ancistrocladus abbreviatus]
MVELGCILFERCDPSTFPAALFYWAIWPFQFSAVKLITTLNFRLIDQFLAQIPVGGAGKRCRYTAGHESENWELVSAEEFQLVPRPCRCILAVYEDALRNPIWAPLGGYHMNPDWVILRKDYQETHGQSTAYMIYLDHENADIVVAIRGLHLGNQSDYAVLFDNKLGQTMFDGGYVHNGLLNAARWVFDAEHEVFKNLLERNPTYTPTFAGHSLGAGVVALLTMVVLQNQDLLGNVERKRIRCYAIAPARCTSLNLAIRYADVVNSVVLQVATQAFL